MKVALKIVFALALSASTLFSGCQSPGQNNEGGQTLTEKREGAWFSDAEYTQSANGNVDEAVIYSGEKYAVMNIADFGELTIKLYPEYAPTAVETFITLAEEGYYDGKNFHRIMKDFMIQGGSKDGDGITDADGPAYGIEVDPKMRHFYGAVSMAKNGLGDCGAQFYITNSKNDGFSELSPNIAYHEDLAEQFKQLYEEAVSRKADEQEIRYYGSNLEYRSNLVDFVKNAKDDVIARYSESGGVAFLDGGYTVFGQVVDGFEVIGKISDVPVDYNKDGEPSVPRVPVILESVKIFTA